MDEQAIYRQQVPVSQPLKYRQIFLKFQEIRLQVYYLPADYFQVDKLDYYCYVDVFKKFIPRIPYYFGNCDVMIDNDKFQNIKECFVRYSAETNITLKKYGKDVENYKEKINSYFLELLGEHYVYFE